MLRLTVGPSLAGTIALLISLSLMFFTTPTVAAQGGNSSIEVHNRICPQDYAGDNWFEDCHSNVPDPGLPFNFTNGATLDGTTSENGNVGFANLDAGIWTITGGAPGEFTDYFVYCSNEGTNEQVPFDYVTGGIQFELAPNSNVVCDWYIIPLSQGGQPTASPTQSTANKSSIEVHQRVCPVGYSGNNWFEDCHGSIAAPGMSFTFSNAVTRTGVTNDEGNVGFANLPAGIYTITGGVPSEFAERFVYCAVGTAETSNQQRIPVDAVAGGVRLELPANTNVICDWYEIPYDLSGRTPTATIAPPRATVAAPTATRTSTPKPLPPGRTLEIVTGTCELDDLSQTVVRLEDLRSPTNGTPVGQDEAITAETSFSIIQMSLTELLAEPYAVVAYPMDLGQSASNPIVCAPIGGVINAEGELVIGMEEQNGSDFTGIVYLAPSKDDSAQTTISVFIANGLADESDDSDVGA